MNVARERDELSLKSPLIPLVPAEEDVTKCHPAQAGTQYAAAKAMRQGPVTTQTLVVMGPRLRGDDSGWIRAEDTCAG